MFGILKSRKKQTAQIDAGSNSVVIGESSEEVRANSHVTRPELSPVSTLLQIDTPPGDPIQKGTRESSLFADFQVQGSNLTYFDRYPRIFLTVSRLSRGMPDNPLKILSFGCSTGEEAACLSRKYFTNDRVIGLDTNISALENAKSNYSPDERISFELSTEQSLFANGPYNIIFAMSVLCRWPEAHDLGPVVN